MSYEINGTIEHIFDTMTFDSGFQKREFSLKVMSGEYEKFPKFEVVKDKCSLLDSFRIGEMVNVKFSVGGNKWNKSDGSINYFTSLSAFYIKTLEAPQTNQGYQPPHEGQYQGQASYQGQPVNNQSPPVNPPPMSDYTANGDDEDDIPF